MVEAMTFLKKQGAEDIYACVTHSVFSDPAVERLTEAPVKEVVVTNTIPHPSSDGKVTVLSLAGLLGEGIRRIHENSSVSSLFV